MKYDINLIDLDGRLTEGCIAAQKQGCVISYSVMRDDARSHPVLVSVEFADAYIAEIIRGFAPRKESEDTSYTSE